MRHEFQHGSEWESHPAGARPVCLFAHFDPGGGIAPHVLNYVAALQACGYQVVVVSSGSRLTAADIDAAGAAGARVVQRDNGGLDFGAWQHLLREGYADGAPGVLLANDSVYGPFWELGRTIAAIRGRATAEPDAWGMVESNQGAWHLQSWFVHLSAALMASRAVKSLFDQPFASMSKHEVIVRGELALGAALVAEGASWSAAFRHGDSSPLSRILPSNPMHLNWRGLITSRRVPFLKAELLRHNPMGIPWVNDWPAVVAAQSDFPTEWIHAHLYSYTGQEPPYPGAPYLSPVRPLGLRGRAFYAMSSNDHMAAARSLAGHLVGSR